MQFTTFALAALAGVAAAAPSGGLEARKSNPAYKCISNFACTGVALGEAVVLGDMLDKLAGPVPTNSTISCASSLCARVTGKTTTEQFEAAITVLEKKCSHDKQLECGRAAIDGKDMKNGYLEFFYQDA